MKKPIKVCLILLVILIAIIGGLTLAINPIIEKLRPEIVSSISSTIKKPVHIGAIKAKIFPTAGIEVQDIGLDGATDAAKLGSLLFESSVPALLSGKISVSRLEITGLRADLVKSADGSLSIGGVALGGAEAAPARLATPPAAAAPTTASPSAPALAFSINEALLNNSHVSFRDETVSPAQTITLDNITLRFAAPDTVAKGLDLELKLAVNDKENVSLKANGAFDGQTLALESAVLNLFGGEISINGKFSTLPGGNFQTTVDGKNVDLGRVCDFVLTGKKSYCLKGTLESLKTSLSGNTQNVGANIQGPVALRIGKGEISGINLIGSTLQKIQGIPGVSGSLASIVPASQQSVLSSSGTAFDSLNITGTLGDNSFSLSELNLQQALYLIQGSGVIGFDGTMNLKTALKLTPAIATSMVTSQPNLKLLQDAQGNLTAPVQITKQDGKIIVLPDLEQLIRQAAGGAAKEAVTKGLNKLLSGQKGGGGNLLKKLF